MVRKWDGGAIDVCTLRFVLVNKTRAAGPDASFGKRDNAHVRRQARVRMVRSLTSAETQARQIHARHPARNGKRSQGIVRLNHKLANSAASHAGSVSPDSPIV